MKSLLGEAGFFFVYALRPFLPNFVPHQFPTNMKRLFRLLRRLVLLLVFAFCAALAYNTFTFSSKQIDVPALGQPPTRAAAHQRLSAAIQLPTVSTQGHIDTLAFEQLDSLITASFPLVDSLLEKNTINHFSLTFHWPGRNPKLAPILLIAHTDVVPVEDASKWAVPPFSGQLRDGFIWGRGSLDDKLGVFGLLESVESLLQEGYTPERSVWLAFGHDEEISGNDGAKAMARFFKDAGLRFEFVLDEGALVLNNALSGLPKPLAMIGIAEKGFATFTLSVQSKAGGHSSMPPRETPIGILATAIARLQERPLPAHIDGATAGMFRYIGPEMRFLNRLLFANLWCSEGLIINELEKEPASNALIRTTTAPTIFQAGVKDNVLPLSAKARVNFRILPGETPQTVAEKVTEIIADERVAIVLGTLSAAAPSPVSSTESLGFKAIQKTAKEVFPDAVVAPALVVAATDSRHYAAVCDNIYRFTPVQLDKSDLKRIHGTDERLSLGQYDRCIAFYRQLIFNSCK
jgi:carboxypeptidase PM20D1